MLLTHNKSICDRSLVTSFCHFSQYLALLFILLLLFLPLFYSPSSLFLLDDSFLFPSDVALNKDLCLRMCQIFFPFFLISVNNFGVLFTPDLRLLHLSVFLFGLLSLSSPKNIFQTPPDLQYPLNFTFLIGTLKHLTHTHTRARAHTYVRTHAHTHTHTLSPFVAGYHGRHKTMH